MSGIWELVRNDLGPDQERINITMLRTTLLGFAFDVLTKLEALAQIEQDLGRPMDTAERNDVNRMADFYDTGDATSRLVYDAKAQYALNSGELNLIIEADFREILSLEIVP